MMSKPVAWMETYRGEPNNLDWDKSNLNYGSDLHDVVPLYTHPVKQLSDEEIEILASKHLCYQIEGSEVSGVYNFARAIIKEITE